MGEIKQPCFRNVHMVVFKLYLQDLFTVTGKEKQNRYRHFPQRTLLMTETATEGVLQN